MNKLKKAFTDKKIVQSTYYIISIIVVIAVLVLINLIAPKLKLKYDLTKNKTYSISDESIDVIRNIHDKITIYAILSDNDISLLYRELLEQYPLYNTNIEVQYKNPDLSLPFLEKYQSTPEDAIEVGSIIVESDKRYKVINASELISTETRQLSTPPYYENVPTSFNIEPKITNTIQYVLQENAETIYYLQGHNEMPLSEEHVQALNDSNLTLKELNLSLEEEIPKDCSALLITTPERDYSSIESEKIINYLENNGKGLFFVDNVPYDLNNFNSILSRYGVEISKGYVFEADSNYSIIETNQAFFSQNTSHEMNQIFERGNLPNGPLFIGPTSINILEDKKSSLDISPLLITSDVSYAKNNVDAETAAKEPGDTDGPFNLAVYIEDNYSVGAEDYSTEIILFSSTSILHPQYDITYTGGIGLTYFVEFAKSLTGNEEPTTFIPPKSLLNTDVFSLTNSQKGTLIIFSLIIIPGVILAFGILNWIRRRNK